MEQSQVEFVKATIAIETKTGWDSAHVAVNLMDDVIEMAANCFKDLDKQTKLDIMASFLHFRYRDVLSFRTSFTKINKLASEDDDEFVRLTADMLSTYLEKQVLNKNLEHWNNSISILNKARESVHQHGISFHAPEHMLSEAENRTLPTHISKTFTQWQPTVKQHLQVSNDTEDLVNPINPLDQLRQMAEREEIEGYEPTESISEPVLAAPTVAIPQKRPSAIELTGLNKRITSPTTAQFASPPTTPTSGGFPPRSFRPPPPSRPPGGGGSSLFITKPRRPAGKPIQRAPSGGGSVRSSTNMPKGFQRPQRVQMLDFNTATELQQNNSDAIKKANDDFKAKKEEEKLEKKRIAEEKKKSADAKRVRKGSVSTEENKDEPEEQQPEPRIPPQLPVKKAYTVKKTEF